MSKRLLESSLMVIETILLGIINRPYIDDDIAFIKDSGVPGAFQGWELRTLHEEGRNC